jgi:hypothetical protein
MWLPMSARHLCSSHPLAPSLRATAPVVTILLVLFWGANHSTRTVAVPSADARTVRGQGSDGPRPSTGAWASCLTAGGPRVRRGRRRSPAAPGSLSREGPRRGG